MFLLTSDLHLTDKARDEYRWGLFPFMSKLCREKRIGQVFILGDLTDEKDKHSATLVNRIVENLLNLSRFADIRILRGNHDCIDPETPFFKFLTPALCGDRLKFITSPTEEGKFLFQPHGTVPTVNLDKFDYVFLHQTFNGAIASNGFKLDGMATDIYKNTTAKVYSGDIHVPQKCGPIEYVGSPYHIHFNDCFEPRLVLAAYNGGPKNIKFPSLTRATFVISDVSELDEKGLKPGDQIKVRLRLSKRDFVEWPSIKKTVVEYCKSNEVELFGVELLERKRAKLDTPKKNKPIKAESHSEILSRYISRENIDPETAKIGLAILEDPDVPIPF